MQLLLSLSVVVVGKLLLVNRSSLLAEVVRSPRPLGALLGGGEWNVQLPLVLGLAMSKTC